MNLTNQTILGRYHVRSLLGEGAMGSVYLADDLELKRQVALKVLRHELASRPDVVQRLVNECQIMARLGPHANIVTLYDRLVHEGDVILVMEYVPGETLSDLIERTRTMNSSAEAAKKTVALDKATALSVLSPSDSQELAKQCLTGLEFAHSKGVLHRDIKPDNILVTRDHNGQLQAKIMDFGIGKAICDASEGQSGNPTLTSIGGPGPGTPIYMAPEQIDPQRFGPVGAAADLYAFGVTLFQMLTLTIPFDGTYTELLNAHTNIDPPDPSLRNPAITLAMRNVLIKALRKKQEERYRSATEFKLDLSIAGSGGGTISQNVGSGGPTVGTRSTHPGAHTSPSQPPQPARQFPWPMICLISILVMAGGGGYAFYAFRKSNESQSGPSEQQKETPISKETPTVAPSTPPTPTPTMTPVVTVAPSPILPVMTPSPEPRTDLQPTPTVGMPPSPPSQPPVSTPSYTAVPTPDPRESLERDRGYCVKDYVNNSSGVTESNLDKYTQDALNAGYKDLADMWEKEKPALAAEREKNLKLQAPQPTPIPRPARTPEPEPEPKRTSKQSGTKSTQDSNKNSNAVDKAKDAFSGIDRVTQPSTPTPRSRTNRNAR